MTPDDFNNIAGGLQSVIMIAAIIIGGIWAFYTFRALGAAQKARAEIAELEQRTIEQPVLMIGLDWRVFDGGTEANHPIGLTARLANDGKRALEVQDLVAIVYGRSASGGVDPEFKPIVAPARVPDGKGRLRLMPSRTLRGGQARNVAFLLPRLPAGDYLVQVNATYSGLVLRDGTFAPSSDVLIAALEQAVVHVP